MCVFYEKVFIKKQEKSKGCLVYWRLSLGNVRSYTINVERKKVVFNCNVAKIRFKIIFKTAL